MQERKTIRISIVVSCRNEIRHIHAFLESLFLQELDGIEMEVLIADGRSADGTRMVLREYERKFSALRVIDNPGKIAATGLNRAIREAQGEIILRMDAHSIYAPNYVRTCIEVLNETKADNVGGPALTRAEGYVAEAIAHAFHAPFAVGGAKFRDPWYEGPVSTVPYGCWRKSTLDCTALFDAELVRGQDDELNFRIVSSGGTVWQSPRIVSWYQPRTSLSALFGQYFRNGFWKVAAIRKHGRPASWRNLAPGLCLFAGIGMPIGAVSASLRGSDTWRDIFLAAWIALVGLYFIASIASAFLVARRQGWRFLPFLPIVFAIYQLSYAAGFLLALFYRPAARKLTSPLSKVVSSISR